MATSSWTGSASLQILGGVATDTADGPTWTPAYLAPEQIGQHEPTQKMMSTPPVCFWELLSPVERRRFCRAILSPSRPHSMLWHGENSNRSRPFVRIFIPELAHAIDTALAPMPERRIINCTDIARAIRKVLHVSTGKRSCENT
jgi:hypothetical protein